MTIDCVRMKSLLSFITFFGLCYCNQVDVSSIDTVPINLVEAANIDGARQAEYVCIGALRENLWSPDELLLGICSPPPLSLSGAVGTLPLSCLQTRSCSVTSSAVTVRYGDLTVPEPVPDTTGSDWDDTDLAATIATPEHIYQTADAIYFVDARSCARKISRNTGAVTTVIGHCDDGTLDIPGFPTGLIYGMTYFESKDMWVFAILNYGIYAFGSDGVGRMLVNRDDMSHVVSDAVRQIVRGVGSDIVWHKIREGVNLYDVKDVSTASGNLAYNETFIRYISASGSPTIDSTARRAIQSDPQLGTSDAALSVSPEGSILLIADTALDKLFFLDIDADDDEDIDPLQEVCEKDNAMTDGPIKNCTFSSITAALWFKEEIILVYERINSSFRIVKLKVPDSSTTTTTEKPRKPSYGGLYGLFGLSGVIPGIIFATRYYKRKNGKCCCTTDKNDTGLESGKLPEKRPEDETSEYQTDKV